ncbi:MAG: DUF5615 family PIN-like protein [Prosthecobacter sp.]|uniref:DUF5615 family PIN-like protein n=1 Tax=Prosthecobacter sp. TaxID=1965333 RepID=UPI0038FFA25F
MPARLYSNENFDRRVVVALRELGHDVLTSAEAGRANQRIPDEEVLEFAKNDGRAVLTFNRLHFLRLHRDTNAEHQGIIVCSTDHDTAALAQRIDETIRNAGALNGQLLRVNRPAK